MNMVDLKELFPFLSKNITVTVALGASLLVVFGILIGVSIGGESGTVVKPSALATTSATPNVEVKREAKTESLNFTIERNPDSKLTEGTEEVRRQGVNGEQIYTYDVTYEDGIEIKKVLVASEVALAPVNTLVMFGTRPKVKCIDVTSIDYNWQNDVLCTRSDGSQFYTDYAGGRAADPGFQRGY